DTFLTVLELSRLRQAEQLQRDLRELVEEVSGILSATLNLGTGLDTFCHGTARLFGADRVSVWLHDRRARHVVLQASSDPELTANGLRVDVDDGNAQAAVAMRSARAAIAQRDPAAVTVTLTVPLRGRRRALGAVIFEGVRVETGGELDLLDRADEL